MNRTLTQDISSSATELIATPGDDTPVWSIDFTRQSPASAGLSFSRASAAGYYDASGNWVIALSNTLRVAYNPLTGLPRGFLCEDSRTNYLLNSNTPATQTVSLSAGNYVLWLEGSGSCSCAAGTASGSGFGTATAATPVSFTLNTAGTVTFTVSGSIARFQCENGTYATSFIATTASAATRAADVCSALLGSLINSAEGTFVITTEIGQSMIMGMDNGSGGYTTRGHIKATRTERNLFLNINNNVRCSYTETTPIESGTRINLALSYSAAGSQCVINGKTVSTSASAANDFAVTALRLGCRFLTGASAFHNAAILKVAYYNKALSLPNLQKITN